MDNYNNSLKIINTKDSIPLVKATRGVKNYMNGRVGNLIESSIHGDLFNIPRDLNVWGMRESLELISKYSQPLSDEVRINENYIEAAKFIIHKHNKPSSGRYNSITESTRNYIMQNALVSESGSSALFNGVKIHDITEQVGSDKYVDLVQLTDTSNRMVNLCVVYESANTAVIYRLLQEEATQFIVIDNYNAINVSENDSNLEEATAVAILEAMLGKSYDINCIYLLDEAVTSVKKVASNVQHKVVQADKKASSKLDGFVDDVKAGAKKLLLPDAKEDVIKDTMPPLSKLIKQACLIGAAWAVNPAVAAITAVTVVMASNKVKREARRKILAELREELEMVEEKIKDAESKGDNKSKYQLMRLRNKLKTSIERIKYGDNGIDGRGSIDKD
ncbi:MAG: hypothetical protein ACRCXX_02410 [Cetobacterium sp.]|uniref:hypothetical protein n=1 Tax=Cetobacterium sp. TaxID=2071632 RepID=UPI003F330061